MSADMMETIRMWHTPYIGAYLLWRFASGYSSASSGRAAPLMLFFIAAALATDRQYYEPVAKRNFKTYHRYFIEKKKLSALVVLQGVINAKREYTCAAIERAVAGGFLEWNSETGTLAARPLKPQKKASLLDDETKRAGNAAEKIGEWFAGESLSDICVLLGVSPT
ncbi:MAG: three component ABC system middle component [Kiritimatiellia bacterium]